MAERKDGRERRRSQPGKPPPPGEAPDVSDEDGDLWIAREPAVDREAIAAREAGIYDEDSPPERPSRQKSRRRPPQRERKRSKPPREPKEEAPPAPDEPPPPEGEGDETMDWLSDIEAEMESMKGRRAEEDAPEAEPGPPEEPEPEPEPVAEEAPRVEEPAGPPPEEPTDPAPEEEEEDDDFAAGIFEPPPRAEEEPAEPAPEVVEPPVSEEPEEAPEPEEISEEAAEEAEPPEEPEPEPAEERAGPLPDTSPGVSPRWVRETWRSAVEQHPERKEAFRTSSGIEIAPLYGPSIRAAKAHDDEVGYPGEFPFTRGVQATMYRGRYWTMRQYAGFASARATNERFRYLLEQGQTGLSVAFDLPTQIGYDSDDPNSVGEVGKVGVPVNSLRDMEVLLEGIPLDRVSLSMTINSSAMILLLMVVAVAKKQSIPIESLRGTVQNDMLKEFVARNTYRFPLDAHLRLVTDLFRYARTSLPRFNMISVSGYHMREAGCTAVQEVAFTLANGIAYLERAVEAGLDVDSFADRVSFFFAAHNNLFEEVAKFRAARRLWARIMRDRFGAKDPRSMRLRFHTQTAGSTLTSKQPETNLVRVTLQALSAVLGGTQSLHTNSFDEALGLPTRKAALLALRTQQVIAHESGVADVVDPLGGNPLVEDLTDAIESEAREYLAKIDEMGGAVEAVRTGWMTREIEAAAYEAQRQIESGEQVVVGVNEYVLDEEEPAEVLSVDQAQVDEVLADLARLKKERDDRKAQAALAALEISTAWGDAELPELVLRCVESYCTLGEICRCLESVLSRDEEG